MNEGLKPFATVGRYRLGPLLGEGGMGVVYDAFDPLLARRVALKVLDSRLTLDPRRVERFRMEARATSLLTHPCIITVHDVGESVLDGQTVHYIAMELVAGQNLSGWIETGRELADVLSLIAHVAEGVAQAHGRGVIHRDLKPDNIMVTDGSLPKILDFGIAKLMDCSPDPGLAFHPSATSLTLPAAIMGTVGYMSPEQIEGHDIDHRSDIFSLGCILYECITGREPFPGATQAERLHATVNRDFSPVVLDDKRLETALSRILVRALAKSPEKRYDSARDLALDLRDIVSPAATELPGPEAPDVRWRSRRMSSLVIGVVLATLAALVTGSGREAAIRLFGDAEQVALLSQNLAAEREKTRRLSAELARVNSDIETSERLRGDLEESYRSLLNEVRDHVRTNESERSKLSTRLARADSELRSYREQQERRQKVAHLAEIQSYFRSTIAAEMNGDSLTLTLPGTLFREGDWQLRGEGIPLLQYLAGQVSGRSDIRIVIEGHTDSSGDADSNVALSQDRADGVRNALIAAGVPAENIGAVGRGESFPAYDNSTPMGRVANRRVNVLVYYEGMLIEPRSQSAGA